MSAHVHPRDVGLKEWEECCVSHMDDEPGGCVRCRVCGQWVRPHKFGEECPGKPPDVVPGSGTDKLLRSLRP